MLHLGCYLGITVGLPQFLSHSHFSMMKKSSILIQHFCTALDHCNLLVTLQHVWVTVHLKDVSELVYPVVAILLPQHNAIQLKQELSVFLLHVTSIMDLIPCLLKSSNERL